MEKHSTEPKATAEALISNGLLLLTAFRFSKESKKKTNETFHRRQ
jgi:hypothetical protein